MRVDQTGTRAQRRLFCLSVSLPVIVLLGLVLAILIKALTVGEMFQLAKLSDQEIDFLNPDTDTQLGRLKVNQTKSQFNPNIFQLGPKLSATA